MKAIARALPAIYTDIRIEPNGGTLRVCSRPSLISAPFDNAH